MMQERKKYATLKGAKRFYGRLANDFKMDQASKDKLEAAESIEKIEHVWKDLLDKI